MEERLNGVCYICGHELMWDKDADNCFLTEDIGEGYFTEEIRCPECGALHRAWVRKDDDCVIGGISDQGFGNCIHCGSTLAWSGDFMRSDYDDTITNEDDDSIVRNLTCSGCGCEVEVEEPSLNEMKSGKYPHWEDYIENDKNN